MLTLLGLTGAWVLGRTQSISNNLTDVRSPSLSTAFRLETALVNQETGIRGYGLTGIADFLAPYRQGLADQKAHVRSLGELLHGDPARTKDLEEVQAAVGRWQEGIAEPVAAEPPGTPSAQATERLANGKAAFDQVRRALENQQERLRADRV
ncbi:histidine kinase, partial [Streptomyces sp. SID7982]|nr:histidine kinase [Streptomyces sp. SID7982]